jgi:hypothetical protein
MCLTQNDSQTQGSYSPYVSKLNLTHNIDDRTQLALRLPELLEICDPGLHDVDDFKSIVDLIVRIMRTDTKRLREAYGRRYNQITEKQELWVRCAYALIAQRETTGFSEEWSDEELKQIGKALTGMYRIKDKLGSWEWMTENPSSVFSGLLPEKAMDSSLDKHALAFNEELLVCFGVQERQSTPPKPAEAGRLLEVTPMDKNWEM